VKPWSVALPGHGQLAVMQARKLPRVYMPAWLSPARPAAPSCQKTLMPEDPPRLSVSLNYDGKMNYDGNHMQWQRTEIWPHARIASQLDRVSLMLYFFEGVL
jgi:hypothetical protein